MRRPRTTTRILLVEDDAATRMALTDRLAADGYEIVPARDAVEGASQARRSSPDLVIMDVMLPGQSGFDLVRQLRDEHFDAPIIMLTARDQLADRVAGLQLGADDYVTKPVEFAELTARIQALLRRARRVPTKGMSEFDFGTVHFNVGAAELTRDGVPVALTRKELELLYYLIAYRGTVCTREDLLDAVWGYQAMSTRTVDVHVGRLRSKLEVDPASPQFLLTVRGIGYKFAS